ncbi:MAG: histidine kinase, partial [Bdellovibrionia bacterium]
MIKLLTTLFSSDGFMPHGHCYLWKPSMVLLQVVSNGLIGLSYAAISATLLYLVHRIRDIAFKWVYLAFGTFIITCSLTHFMDVWTVWTPLYWVDGTARAITAVASVATAVLLPFLVPKICMFAQTSRLALDRGIRVETAYQDLNKIFERT